MADQLSNWRRLIDGLDSKEKDKTEYILGLESFFLHSPTQVAVRLQPEYESLTRKTNQLFCKNFDKIDLSDKNLLCSYLKMMRSFAYFRIAQITYYVEGPIDESEPDPIYTPLIEKAKWYELSPLLSKAGTIGWKNIMNHGLVKEEQHLIKICLQLLSQKLQFLAIISKLDRFQAHSQIIKRNGEKVAEKLFELIRDVAYDDDSMIGMDTNLFELLRLFTNPNQQAAIIEAVVQDLFKPHLLQKSMDDEIRTLHKLITNCFICNSTLQDVLFQRMIDHLRCNLIRRKRRHSVEVSQENQTSSIEGLLSDISENTGHCPIKLLNSLEEFKISDKSLQGSYLSYWIKTMLELITQRILTGNNSIRIISTCSIILVSTSRINFQDENLSKLLAKAIYNTTQAKLEQVFNKFSPLFLVELTKSLSSDKISESFSYNPLYCFYDSYLDRFLKFCIFKSAKNKIGEYTDFVNFICDKSLRKDVARLLQYICLQQLADAFETFKSKANIITESYLECARLCSKSLYKPIKRCSFLKTDSNNEALDESQEINENGSKNVIYIEALICILKIAIGRKDQAMLDSYGEQLIRLFSTVKSRVQSLVENVQAGSSTDFSPLDAQITKLLTLYIEHKDMIKAYLDYDLIESLAPLLITEKQSQINGFSEESMKKNKKTLYKQIKAKLDELEERSKTSMDVYPTIINKQYNSVTNQSLSLANDIEQGKPCFHGYANQMRILSEVSSSILRASSRGSFLKVMNSIIHWLEYCDPLNHPRVLYFLLILESLVTCQATNEFFSANFHKELFPKISCSLVRITKSVELGPSIHAFTNSGKHRTNKGIQCCTYATCIKIYSLLLTKSHPKIGDNLITTDAMQICISSNLMQYARYSMRLHDFFVQLAFSIAGLLKSIGSSKKEDILKTSMPIFLALLSHLIRCILLASDRQKLENMSGNSEMKDVNDSRAGDENNVIAKDEKYEAQLELLAMDVGRILKNLATLRVKLVEYAPHLISTYIRDIQRASCSESVRLHLNEGMFRIFNLVDAHQKERQEEIVVNGVQRKTIAGRANGSLFEMIHARLDQASREIFRDMYDNYNNFHRYLAKC